MSTSESDSGAAAQRRVVVADFAAALRQLRLEAGKPSFRAMAGATGAISHTTLHEAASGARLPSWPTTRSYVRACGGSEEEWHRRWLAAACAASVPESPECPGSTAPEPEPDAPAVIHTTPPEPAEPAPPHRLRRQRRFLLTHLAMLTAGVLLGATLVLATMHRATATVATPVAPPAPSYVARVGAGSGTAYRTSTTVHVRRTVPVGDTLVVPVMLTNTHPGAVEVTDSRGNSYTTVADQNDGAASDRTLVFTATVAKALSTADTIVLSYPSTNEQHVVVDELANVRAVDQHAAATGAKGTDFDSGAAPSTSTGLRLVFGVAGVQGGAAATWTDGFTPLPTLFVSDDQLATGYKTVTAAGAYAAVGTCDHQWMAAVVAFA
ncbi:helix-turn-helix transcriptional regulator [Kitasatospora sp. NPDC002227]|uniref:helix-turn-helix domain-containing protein n=1 Tax=Kitasatospora sp. NPDC002227 TaxID=3154773 RepID=UPI0033268734